MHETSKLQITRNCHSSKRPWSCRIYIAVVNIIAYKMSFFKSPIRGVFLNKGGYRYVKSARNPLAPTAADTI